MEPYLGNLLSNRRRASSRIQVPLYSPHPAAENSKPVFRHDVRIRKMENIKSFNDRFSPFLSLIQMESEMMESFQCRQCARLTHYLFSLM
jgi:hypothetical protein